MSLKKRLEDAVQVKEKRPGPVGHVHSLLEALDEEDGLVLAEILSDESRTASWVCEMILWPERDEYRERAAASSDPKEAQALMSMADKFDIQGGTISRYRKGIGTVFWDFLPYHVPEELRRG